MTTAEAARAVGVPIWQMLRWHQEGWLTPADNGKDGRGRRLEWSAKDVEQAKDLSNQDSSKSASEAMIDSLGGQDFVTALGRARSLEGSLLPQEVVIAGPRGAKIIPRKSLVESAVAIVGAPLIVIEYSPVE